MVKLAALLACLAAPAGAADCRLALLLAMDVSSSVDAQEDRLQRQGTARALRSPEVIEAFFAADVPVALAAFEWSGIYQQTVMLDWTMIETPADLSRAADTIGASRRAHTTYPTAIGAALNYGAQMMRRAPACLKQTIDMSGDGQNNDGWPPASSFLAEDFSATTVNGLVINAADFEGELGLIAFYRAEVMHGPGAFLMVADGFTDFPRAMRRKLVREVSPPAIGAVIAPETGSASAPDSAG